MHQMSRLQWLIEQYLQIAPARPDLFSRYILGVDLYDKQMEILDALSKHDRVCVRSCNSAGKTFVASVAVLWFLFSHKPAKVVTTSAQKAQVKLALWSEIKTRVLNARVPLSPKKPTSMYFELEPEWYAVGIKPQEYNIEGFQGFHSPNTLLVFDEASGIAEAYWEAGNSVLTQPNSKWLAIGNPLSKSSPFYDCFNDPLWYPIHISAFDTPNVKAGRNISPNFMSYDWPERMKSTWGEDSPQYLARVLGEFPDSDEQELISKSLAKQVIFRKPVVPPPHEPVVIGLDPSGLGPDSTVWVVRQGLLIHEIRNRKEMKDTEIAEFTVELVKKYSQIAKQVTVNIDGGWGKGVYEAIIEKLRGKYECRMVFMSALPDDQEAYFNLRTECAFKLKNAIEIGLTFSYQAKTQATHWVDDVSSPKFTIDANGRKQLESKRTLKKRLKRSPDYLDATLLTFVGPEEIQVDLSKPNIVFQEVNSGIISIHSRPRLFPKKRTGRLMERLLQDEELAELGYRRFSL